MDKRGYIYKHTNLLNNKVYIGQTTQIGNIRYRKGAAAYKSCTLFYRAIIKYGWDNFNTEILCYAIDNKYLNELEEYFINLYDSCNVSKGYNLVRLIGGETKLSNITKLKISNKLKQYYAENATNPAVNKKPHIFINNQECKECSACKEVLPLDEFSKNSKRWDNLHLYCRQCWSEYFLTHNTRKKLSKEEFKQSYIDRKEKMRDHVISAYKNNPEIKQKIAKARSKPIKAINVLTNEVLTFSSATEAKKSGFNNSNIGEAIKYNKQYKGYLWSFNESTNNEFNFLIFDHERKDSIKMKIWKSMINAKKNNVTKIYARKCEIKHISYGEAAIFMNNNHIQGEVSHSVAYGLFYKEELVSVMSFGKSRYNKNYEYELLRYANKLNIAVIGGAGKLLNAFILEYSPKSIISYANLRFSEGKLYEKLNFTFLYKSTPNYFYIKDNIIYSRIQAQKAKLSKLLENFNPNLSESENMKINGFKKITDRGNLVYVLLLDKNT